MPTPVHAEAMGHSIDWVVVGAGVVGLACGRELAQRGERVLLVERHASFGRETSSRNSGVVHAGLYYRPDSWMARACVDGRRRLYAYCARRGVPFVRTGKLVLALDADDEATLAGLAERAAANGVAELDLLSRRKLARREPLLSARRALWVGESGLVDAHELMRALMVDLRALDGEIAFGTEVTSIEATGKGVRVTASTDGESSEVRAHGVVCAAGHAGLELLRRAGVDTAAQGLNLTPVAGRYFKLSTAAPRPEASLVYPLPSAHGLGVHLTRDLSGQTRAGPDAAVGVSSLEVPQDLRERFCESVRRYLPSLRPEQLAADFTGLRPRLEMDADRRDFRLLDGAAMGAPGSFHLLGIESPGLTASLALAHDVADHLLGDASPG